MNFRGKTSAIHRFCGLVQIAQGVVETLRHTGGATQDSLLGVEKGLLQCLDDPDTMPLLSQLTQNINREMDKPNNERY